MLVSRRLGKCLLGIGITVLGNLQFVQAADRTFTGTASSELTLGGAAGNWNGAAVPGTADRGIFNQGQASGTGFDAPTAMTLTGTLTPQRLLFQNLVPVSISGTGTMQLTPGNSARYIDGTPATASIDFNNDTLRFVVNNTATDTGIVGTSDTNATLTVNTTNFVFAAGNTNSAKKLFIETNSNATPGSIVVNPTADFSQIAANQALTMNAYEAASITLNNGITGSNSFNSDVNVNPGTDAAVHGKVIIGGTSNFLGATTVSAGTLIINGAYNGSGATTLNAGAILGGVGAISAVVNQSGIIAPGSSAGTLTVGGLTVSDGSGFNFELNPANNAVGGGVNDLIAISGLLDVSMANASTVSLNVQNVGGGDFSGVGVWTLMTYGSINPGTFDPALINITGLASGFTGLVSVNPANNSVVLTTVPEPTAVALGGLAAIALVVARLRQRPHAECEHKKCAYNM